MALKFNTQWSCALCRRQADDGAVGREAKYLWHCDECGIPRSWKVFNMPQKEFLFFEKRALEKVRSELMEGDLVVPEAEVEIFLEWLINTFGEKIREELDSGNPPF